MDKVEVILTSCKREAWLYELIQAIERVSRFDIRKSGVSIILPEEIRPDKLEPFHIVLLSCFIEHLNRSGCFNITVSTENSGVLDIIRDKLKIAKYFQGYAPSYHEESGDDTISNLWKVVNSESYAY